MVILFEKCKNLEDERKWGEEIKDCICILILKNKKDLLKLYFVYLVN